METTFAFPWSYRQRSVPDLHYDLRVTVEKTAGNMATITEIKAIGIDENAVGLTPHQYNQTDKELARNPDFRRKAAIALQEASA